MHDITTNILAAAYTVLAWSSDSTGMPGARLFDRLEGNTVWLIQRIAIVAFLVGIAGWALAAVLGARIGAVGKKAMFIGLAAVFLVAAGPTLFNWATGLGNLM